MQAPKTASLACLLLIATACGVAAAHAGEPVVRVETDEAANAAKIHASIDIAASSTAVWAVLTDCARMPQIFPNLESCRIIKHDGAGKWEIREHVINWAVLMPKLRTLVRNTYETGRRLAFKRIGGDMRLSDGEWRLEPIGARGTRLTYNALFAPDFTVPQFLLKQAVQTDMPNMLRAIEKASVADAAKQ